MAGFVHDLRYTLRALRKSPGFTAAIILTLTIGIGANAAFFSVIDSLLLRPLPYPDAGRIVTLWSTQPDGTRTNLSPADFLDYRDQSRVFEHMGAVSQVEFNVVTEGTADRLTGFRISAGLLEALGTRPELGRRFTADDDRPGAPQTVILSYAAWQTKFGGDRGILGQVLSVDGEPATVIGVLPRSFRFVFSPEMLAPLAIGATASRSDRILCPVAKLKKGVTFAQAQQEVQRLAGNLAQAHPESSKGWSAEIVNLREIVVGSPGDYRDVLVLFGAVALVLLIACLNVANLLLVKASARQRELAVRASMGAVRSRLIRQVLTEGTVLALLGGAAGVLLALWLSKLAAMLVPAVVVDAVAEIGLNVRVLWFTVGISLLTGVLFSLAPAWRTSRLDLTRALAVAGRGTSATPSSKRFRSALVVVEIAMSLILLAGSGLMIRSVVALYATDLGLRPEGVTTMRLSMPAARYSTPAQVRTFDRALLEKVRALPGVRSASLSLFLPLEGMAFPIAFQLASHPVSPTERPRGRLHFASEGHFETFGMTLRAGRVFTARDHESAPRVAIVNEAFAREQFKNEDPLGQRLLMGLPVVGTYGVGPDVDWQIVGVIADEREPGGRTYPRIYVPAMQWPQAGGALAVRSDGDTAALVKAIRGIVKEIDATVPITAVRTMREIAMSSASRPKMQAWVMGAFAAVALILAALGIYAVMSFSVAQRSHELGIRMALGAQPGDLMRMMLRYGVAMASAGLALGLAGAFALTHVLQSVLYNVKATDPLTYAGASALLFAITMLAAYIPARRAANSDPNIALRCE